MQKNKPLKVAVIREELVELTGDAITALILNQAIVSHNSTVKMDEGTQESIDNLISMGQVEMAKQLEETVLREGWFYKSPNSFYKEIMISSRSTVKRRLEILTENGYLIKGGQFFKQMTNKKGDVIEDSWWKVNIHKIRKDLFKLGYALNGYPIWSVEEETSENFAPVHYEQGGVHSEQGVSTMNRGVSTMNRGHVHHEHQHRLLNIDNNKDNIIENNLVNNEPSENELVELCNQYYAEFSPGRWSKKQWLTMVNKYVQEFITYKKFKEVDKEKWDSYIYNSIKNMAYKKDLKKGKVNPSELNETFLGILNSK